MRSSKPTIQDTKPGHTSNAGSHSPDYKQIVGLLPTAVYTCDVNGTITQFNDAAARIWGRTPLASRDKWTAANRILDAAEKTIGQQQMPMAIACAKGKDVARAQLTIEQPDGKKINVISHSHTLFDTEGRVTGVVTTMIDLSDIQRYYTEEHFSREGGQDVLEREVSIRTAELQRKNEELRLSEERYHRMVAEVQDYAILLLDKDGFIQNWNLGAERIKGYTANEIIGKNFRVFYTPEDRANLVPDRLIEAARTNQRANQEGWRVRKDGTRFWGSTTITSLHDEKKEVIGFTKVTRDLTERKKAEDAVLANAAELQVKNRQLAQMNQELASFAYVSSHDLQEPLRKIQTFATRIIETEEGTLSAKAKDYFSRMQNAASRMQTLIEDLLSYSRTNTEEKVFLITDLNTVLDEVTADLKERMEEKSATISHERLPVIPIIKFQFRQLLINVIGNALKFAKPDVPPVIRITCEKVSGKEVGPHAQEETTYAHIAIHDNGIGFEPEHRFKIFEVFQRLHGRSEYSGTGIGLAICKKIMDNHNGFMSADSELGKGATFHLYFPMPQNEKAT